MEEIFNASCYEDFFNKEVIKFTEIELSAKAEIMKGSNMEFSII